MVTVTENTAMRDAFFNRIYELAKEDKNLFVIAADMGAPALDKFRKDFTGQYLDAGIAEQNAVLVAAGLAHSGKKPYVYAITPFITNRIHEFIKLELGLMKLPVIIVGMGTGYSYDDSGPTHHIVEDISVMTPIPNLEIYSPSDSCMAAVFAEVTARTNNPVYIRLDRKNQRIKYANATTPQDFSAGFNVFQGKQTKNKLCIVATGNIVDIAIDVQQRLLTETGQSIDVIDIYRLKPLGEKLKDVLANYSGIVSVEEQLLRGGFGSIISEIITDNDLPAKLRRIGVPGYNYEYGGRATVQAKMGITQEAIINAIKSLG